MGDSTEPLVYLDTADWAYLQEGKAGDAEVGLRRLAADGRIVFLISEEHLVEVAGLTSGREQRLAFIRSFPGTVRFPYSTHDVLRHNAWQLVELVEGRDVAPTSVPARPLSDVPWSELMDELGELAVVRDSLYLGAEIMEEGRLVDGKETAADVRATDEMLSAFAVGDPTKITRQLVRMGQLSPEDSGIVEQRVGVALEALRSGGLKGVMGWVAEQIRNGGHDVSDDQIQLFEQTFEEVEWDPALLLLDPIFQRAVVPYLPDDVKYDRERLAAVAKGWRKIEIRSRVPGLAAYAALIKAIHFEPRRKLEGSEMLDRRHAVYSPMVILFTCDKRNERPLRDMFLSFGSSAPIIARTKRLTNIARALLSGLGAPS